MFCRYCGKKQITENRKRQRRANGDGSIYQLSNKKFIAVKTLYYFNDGGKNKRKTQSKTLAEIRQAIEYLNSNDKDKHTAFIQDAVQWLLQRSPSAERITA